MTLKRVVVVVLALYLSVVVVIVFRISSSDDDNHRNYSVVEVETTTGLYIPENVEELIAKANSEQRIYNENLYGDTIELVVVVQVHRRPLYLQQLINSLENTPSINKTLLIFSHDWVDPNITHIVQSVKFAKVLQIFYPFSLQTHPEDFPGPDVNDCVTEDEKLVPECPNFDFRDTYGKFRNASVAQIKHHWWWKANFVFKEVKILNDYTGLVLFVEEDHYLAPDFIHCLSLMRKTCRYYCPNCWFLSLGVRNRVNFGLYSDWVGIQNTVENSGLAFNRTIWNEVSKYREDFCQFDDYNWDWSLKNVFRNVPGETSSMVMVASRVYHVGSCGTHSDGEICDPTELIQDFKNRQTNLFPDSFYVTFDNNQEIVDRSRPNGGWGDPRDHELCMKM
ncbi:alpha-1,6-mannosyl-glycoprotein 2-beta-N-acetylglucosaminyltransferase-like [Zophobas morio]|uniref:alpha-1,6-mannosyl-glycoprotein 2-beta-N-acetylglucosaminyltransferase-like n=1 Tax=Zophobas morio TaxID=2755281 RepID=UPI003082D06E